MATRKQTYTHIYTRDSQCNHASVGLARDFFFSWAQFSRKLGSLYEYSYLGPVLYMNIHIVHDTKVFVTLRKKKKKKNEISIPCP